MALVRLRAEQQEAASFHLSRVRNMLVAHEFLARLRRKYGKKTIYKDGGACTFKPQGGPG